MSSGKIAKRKLYASRPERLKIQSLLILTQNAAMVATRAR